MKRIKSAAVALAVMASAFAFASPASADTQASLDPTFDNGTGYDGRGDLIAAGGGYTDDRAYVAVTRRTHDVPTGTNWSDYTTGRCFGTSMSTSTDCPTTRFLHLPRNVERLGP